MGECQSVVRTFLAPFQVQHTTHIQREEVEHQRMISSADMWQQLVGFTATFA